MKRTLRHTKSSLMRQWHPQKIVHVEGVDYEVIDINTNFATTQETNFASVGSEPSPHREICTYNIATAGKDFTDKELQKKSDKERLEYVFGMVNLLFKLKSVDNAKIELFIALYLEKHAKIQDQNPVTLPLEKFVGMGIACCRHRSLYLAACLGNLCKRGLLNSDRVRIIRDVLFEGTPQECGHAWVSYTTDQEDLYLLDPMHGAMLCLDNPEERKIAEQAYGKDVIDRMILRGHAAEQREELAASIKEISNGKTEIDDNAKAARIAEGQRILSPLYESSRQERSDSELELSESDDEYAVQHYSDARVIRIAGDNVLEELRKELPPEFKI